MKKAIGYFGSVLLLSLAVLAQSNVGELRLKVTGPDGLPLKASVELSSDAFSSTALSPPTTPAH